MATDTVITLPHARKRTLTAAERAKRYRQNKKAKGPAQERRPDLDLIVAPVTAEVEALPVTTVTPITPAPVARMVGAPLVSSIALRTAAIGLALVGLSMNAVYARSLGSSDLSGWLFLALGLCADCAALALPTVAASTRGGTRAAAWLTWAVVFAFAILGSVGFASTSISDVTQARSSRVTPAVTAAQAALSDAQAARDRECKGGVGRFCRDREAAVLGSAAILKEAMSAVASTSDPQVEAATRLVSWISAGAIKPTPDDFAMVRLLLLALLPQVGGILLMVARTK